MGSKPDRRIPRDVIYDEPQLVPVLNRAYALFDLVKTKGCSTSEQLQPIIDLASSHRVGRMITGTKMLRALLHDHPEAMDAVSEMSCDSKARVRENAQFCINRQSPREFSLKLIRRGLGDRSCRVRSRAADQALGCGMNETVSDLEIAYQVERHEKTKETLRFSLLLLRDGYLVQWEDPHGFFVVVYDGNRCTGGRLISREEVETIGMEAAIAKCS